MSRLQTTETGVKRLLREWPLVFVFGCIVFMLHSMLHADFAVIDDHEIVSILGGDNRVIFSGFTKNFRGAYSVRVSES